MSLFLCDFFLTHPATPDIYTLSLHDALPILLKYVRRHPVARVTIAGGFAKMTKLGQGLLDLHSRAGEVDLAWLADIVRDRKSTRLNSSHMSISYAVFCLKKKKT